MKMFARHQVHSRNRGIVVALDLALGVSSFVLAVFLLQDDRGAEWSRAVLTFGFPCVLFARLVGISGLHGHHSAHPLRARGVGHETARCSICSGQRFTAVHLDGLAPRRESI